MGGAKLQPQHKRTKKSGETLMRGEGLGGQYKIPTGIEKKSGEKSMRGEGLRTQYKNPTKMTTRGGCQNHCRDAVARIYWHLI